MQVVLCNHRQLYHKNSKCKLFKGAKYSTVRVLKMDLWRPHVVRMGEP